MSHTPGRQTNTRPDLQSYQRAGRGHYINPLPTQPRFEKKQTCQAAWVIRGGGEVPLPLHLPPPPPSLHHTCPGCLGDHRGRITTPPSLHAQFTILHSRRSHFRALSPQQYTWEVRPRPPWCPGACRPGWGAVPRSLQLNEASPAGLGTPGITTAWQGPLPRGHPCRGGRGGQVECTAWSGRAQKEGQGEVCVKKGGSRDSKK